MFGFFIPRQLATRCHPNSQNQQLQEQLLCLYYISFFLGQMMSLFLLRFRSQVFSSFYFHHFMPQKSGLAFKFPSLRSGEARGWLASLAECQGMAVGTPQQGAARCLHSIPNPAGPQKQTRLYGMLIKKPPNLGEGLAIHFLLLISPPHPSKRNPSEAFLLQNTEVHKGSEQTDRRMNSGLPENRHILTL